MVPKSQPKQPKKGKSSKQSGKPSSLAHYTSLKVLNIILDRAIETGSKYLVFQLSEITQMNDELEGNLLNNKFFTSAKVKQDLKRLWDDFLECQRPFIFSLSNTPKKFKDGGILPMWKMYGDNCKGVLIRFDYRELEQYLKRCNIKIVKCSYVNTSQINNICKEKNWGYKHAQLARFFEEYLNDYCRLKRTWWEYEREWRAIYKAKPSDIIYSEKRHIVELSIPIECVNGILLGPLTDNHLEIIEEIKEKLTIILGKEPTFTIQKSNISIRY